MRNKKGSFDILDVFAIIAIFLLIATFVFFVNILRVSHFLQDSEKQQIYGEDAMGSSITLINYLRTPVEDGQTISDLIITSYNKKDYSKLESKTRELLKNLNSENKENKVMLIKDETLIKEIKITEELSNQLSIVKEINLTLDNKNEILVRWVKYVKK